MEFRLVTYEEFDQVRNLDNAARQIRRRTQNLIGKLAAEFNGNAPGGFGGIEFAALDNPRVVGTAKTAFGNGRIRLEWTHDGNELLGRIVVDRETFDQLDRVIWEPVFAVSIRENAGWGPLDKTAAPPNYLDDPTHRDWALGASIAYSILKGPVVS